MFANCLKEVGCSALASFFYAYAAAALKAAYCTILQAILQPLVIRLAQGMRLIYYNPLVLFYKQLLQGLVVFSLPLF